MFWPIQYNSDPLNTYFYKFVQYFLQSNNTLDNSIGIVTIFNYYKSSLSIQCFRCSEDVGGGSGAGWKTRRQAELRGVSKNILYRNIYFTNQKVSLFLSSDECIYFMAIKA